MSRNSILAFVLIFASIYFFTSPFYYTKVLHQKSPSFDTKNIPDIKTPENNSKEIPKKVILQDTPVYSPDTLNTSRRKIVVITDKLICCIYEKGALIQSVNVPGYVYNGGSDKGNTIDLVQKDNGGGGNLSIDNYSFDSTNFSFGGPDTLRINQKTQLDFVSSTAQNGKITKRYSFENGTYKIQCSIIGDKIAGKTISLGWKSGISESEEKPKASMSQPLLRQFHFFDGNTVEHETRKQGEEEELSGSYRWIAVSSKYFLIALVADSLEDGDIHFNSFSTSTDVKKPDINYSFQMKRLSSETTTNFWFYAGPSKVESLRQFGISLEKVLYKGYGWFFFADRWFPPLCEAVLWLLVWLQGIVNDYGIVIILLTVILKLVTFPLTQSSMKSMKQMSEIQPEITKIRDKYKTKPQVMNQKLMEFYKEKNINPLAGAGGCLPLLLQMPIMISLYIVLNKAIELRGHGTVLIPWVKDLTQPEIFIPLGFEIPWYGASIALLPIIMAVLMYFQNKMTIKDPNQQAMIWMMPIIMLVMFNNFPAGLSLYFVFSSILQIIQQVFVNAKTSAPISVKN